MGYVAWNGQTYEGTPPEGWHEAGDGRWWPIGQGPVVDATTPPAPPTTPPPPPPVSTGPYATPTAVAAPPAAPKQRSGCLVAALVVIAILTVLALVGVAGAIFLADSDGDEAADIQVVERSDEDASEGSNPPITSADDMQTSGAADEIDDVRSCSWVDDEVMIELVNNSSKTSNYVITTAYLDDSGSRVGDEVHFLNSVRPEQVVREKLLAIEDPTAGCDVIDVERFAAQSAAEELAEIGACELGPPDFLDDATATLVATNSSSKISTYWIEVSFLDESGVRVGHGTASINSVRPGESAPGDVTSFSDAAGITSCEVVSVTRNEST